MLLEGSIFQRRNAGDESAASSAAEIVDEMAA